MTGSTHIPLNKAYLCENCDEIGDNSETCPGCGSSTSLMCLATVLNRNEDSNFTVDNSLCQIVPSVHINLA